MKQKVYTFIGAAIITSGFFWYMQLHMQEYAVQQQLESKASSLPVLNPETIEVNGLLGNNQEQLAIDKLIDMVKDNPDDLGVKLKLTQVYCNQCVLDTINCEQAMWQLNSILKSNPEQQDALELKERLSVFLRDTLSVNE